MSANLPRIIGAICLLVFTGAACILPAASASASVRLVVPPPDPGGGQQFGMAKAEFPTTGQTNAVTGWDVRSFATSGTGDPAQTGVGSPTLFTLSDPYYSWDYQSFIIDVHFSSLSDSRPDVGVNFLRINTPVAGSWACGSVGWGDPGSSQALGGSSVLQSQPGSTAFVNRLYASPTGAMGYCGQGYQSMTFDIQTTKLADFTFQHVKATWSAYRYASGKTLAFVDPAKAICAAAGYSSAVAIVACKDNMPDLPTSEYCAGAPAINLLDPPTLSTAAGFWINCLFNPRRGFDSKGAISTAMSSSALGEANFALSRIGDAFQYSTVCGKIGGDVTSGPLRGFAINTCSWTPFAPQMKLVLTWGIVIGFGFWAINFAIEVLMGLFNMKTPSPVGKDAK